MSDARRRPAFRCVCRCGMKRVVPKENIERGLSLSCGCRRAAVTARTHTRHGMSGTSEYATWARMHRRCSNPRDDSYPYYGGAGIRVCARWSGESGFENFFADLGLRPSSAHSLERKNPGLGYAPGNCVWATRDVQANNKKSTVFIEIFGERMALANACRRFGVPVALAHSRRRIGWSDVEAVTIPVDERRSRSARERWGGAA